MNKANPWKTNEVRVVKELRDTHTCEQIGKILGRSAVSVWHKCSDLGLTVQREPRRRWSEEEDSRLIEGIESFIDWKRVSRFVGRSVNACQVRSCLKKLHRKYVFWTDERKQELLEMRARGVSYEKLADHFGMSTRAIRQAIGRFTE